MVVLAESMELKPESSISEENPEPLPQPEEPEQAQIELDAPGPELEEFNL